MINGLFSDGTSIDVRAVKQWIRLAAGALGFAIVASFGTVATPVRADLPLASPSPVADKPGSVTHGHVFLHGPQGDVDVTPQLAVCAGQTYVVCSSGCIPIFINYSNGLVFDDAGFATGYIDLG